MSAGHADKPVDRRKQDRMGLIESCSIKYGEQLLSCSLSDISTGGAKIHSEVFPEIGESIEFKSAHMTWLRGTVVRVFPDGFSVRFDPSEAKKAGVNDVLTYALNDQR